MNQQLPSFDLLYTETRDLLIRQLDSIEGVDAKAGILAGFDALILTASLAILKDFSSLVSAVQSHWQPYVLPVLAMAGISLAAGSLIASLLAYRISTYKELLAPRAVYKELMDQPLEKSKMQLMHNFIASHEANARILRRKSLFLQLAGIGLLLAGLCFAFAALAYLAAL